MIEILNQVIQDGVDRGLLQKSTEDSYLYSSTITMQDEDLVNFGSCSYMGLEFNERLTKGVKDAVDNFGTQFSTSRTYLSLGLYDILEAELEKIFNKPLIVSASTTLGHLACLPVIIEEGDAVILDLQVHSSVQMTSQILKAQKIPTYIIPHNSLENLEAKIKTLSNQHKRIWYFADGVYSMYGDYAPLKELEILLNKYKQFYLYIDDAHGMGWTGKNGAGYVRSVIEHHDKMVLATSLNKSFASSGGVIVFPNEGMKRKVKNCGATLIFSGPIQPPMLGAAIESARLHQTKEFEALQKELQHKIEYTNKRLKELDLPQYQTSSSPLFFIPVGLPRVTLCIIKRMKQKGFYMNAAGFPAVPMKKGGIRFMINNNLSIEEIESMLVTLQEQYIYGLHEEGSSPEEVAKSFKLKPFLLNHGFNLDTVSIAGHLTDAFYGSISEIDQDVWNHLFSANGSNEYLNLLSLEKLFNDPELIENQWDINYHIVRDKNDNIVLASVYTVALMMDDLLADKSVSEKVKEIRKNDKYFLTSKTLLSGTPFTKGKSVYIDFNHDDWKEAVKLHVTALQEIAENEEVSKLIIREFCLTERNRLKAYLLELGLIETKLPDNLVLRDMKWDGSNGLSNRLTQKYRYSLKNEILKKEDLFDISFDKPITAEQKLHAYQLYLNVHSRSTDISVFKLPYELFEQMYEDSSYDIISLYLKGNTSQPIGIMFSQILANNYNALIVGLDYDFVKSYNTYKQILYKTVLRARELNCNLVDLAYTAEMEKKKVGALPEESFAFSIAMEHFSHALLESLK